MRQFGVLVALSLFSVSCGAGDQGEIVSSDEQTVSAQRTNPKESVTHAIEATMESSYAFSQELKLDIDLLGERSTLSSGKPIATGVSSGEDLTITADLGPFFRQVVLAGGATEQELVDPFIVDMLSIETGLWVVGDKVTIDIRQFVNVFDLALFQTTNDRPPQASSPISIDRPRLQALGPDEDEGASRRFVERGHSALVTNPVRLLAVLESLTETLDPTEVATVSDDGDGATYRFEVPYIEYARGLNQDLAFRLDLAGVNLSFNSKDWPERRDQAIREASVEISVSIDSEGLLRTLTSEIDVGTFAKYWSSHDLDVLEESTFEIVDMTVTTFEQHGESFAISSPEAVDVTSSIIQ